MFSAPFWMVVEDFGSGGCGVPAAEAVGEEDVGVRGEDYDVAGGVVDVVEHCVWRFVFRGRDGLERVGVVFECGR
jgi:hypothetical protein